jgi:hypothetical protein
MLFKHALPLSYPRFMRAIGIEPIGRVIPAAHRELGLRILQLAEHENAERIAPAGF